jgi:MFS family permease
MTAATPPAPRGIWTGALLWLTLGATAIIFLGAFDALAVTTIMPTVAHDLDGASLYSAAFSATLAAGVIGTVAAGAWSDRRGPVLPLVGAVAVFVVGLVVAATAVTMPVFVIGRFLQGLGNGASIVSLYVIVARAYPPALHTRMFSAFAAAWIVPGLIGPVAAGAVAEGPGWRWVFVGVAVLVGVALATVAPSLLRVRLAGRAPDDAAPPPPSSRVARDLVLATLLAIAVVGIAASEELPTWAGWITAGVGVVAAVILFRPLLPPGTLTAARGLGATVLMRGVIAAAYFSTEVRLPYLLQAHYGLTPWQAGLILTVGAVAWGGSSVVLGRWGDRLNPTRMLVSGAALLAIGIALQLAVAAITPPLPVALVLAGIGWVVSACGMGAAYPQISTMMLRFSTPSDQGFNSSALSNLESVAGATAIALGGLVFAAAGGTSGLGFPLSILFALVIAAFALPVARRVGRR